MFFFTDTTSTWNYTYRNTPALPDALTISPPEDARRGPRSRRGHVPQARHRGGAGRRLAGRGDDPSRPRGRGRRLPRTAVRPDDHGRAGRHPGRDPEGR